MGTTFYNKELETYERTIKINGVSATLYSKNKKTLEDLKYRQGDSQSKAQANTNI